MYAKYLLSLLLLGVACLVREVEGQSPAANVFTETFIFDRLFYYFPFGYYSQSPAYDSDKRAKYVV